VSDEFTNVEKTTHGINRAGNQEDSKFANTHAKHGLHLRKSNHEGCTGKTNDTEEGQDGAVPVAKIYRSESGHSFSLRKVDWQYAAH
jgi:hypothetical protein